MLRETPFCPQTAEPGSASADYRASAKLAVSCFHLQRSPWTFSAAILLNQVDLVTS